MDNIKKNISNIEKVEESLKQLWADYGSKTNPIKAVHTEVVIEPRPFLGKELNPELAELMVSVYLSHCSAEDVKRGKITVEDGCLTIKDKYGKPVVVVRKQKIVREFIDRISAV